VQAWNSRVLVVCKKAQSLQKAKAMASGGADEDGETREAVERLFVEALD